jgi:hypothetical protein
VTNGRKLTVVVRTGRYFKAISKIYEEGYSYGDYQRKEEHEN